MPAENPSNAQVYLIRTMLGRMIKQVSNEKRVLKFLFVAIIKMDWPELLEKAKRYLEKFSSDFKFI